MMPNPAVNADALTTAKALALTFPKSLVVRAEEAIQ